MGGSAEITIAQLDEALFGAPRLKEFTALVIHGHPSTLIVTAVGFQEGDIRQETLHKLLDAVPAIRSAEQSGELEVVIKIAEDDFPLRAGKRQIMEQVA